MSAPPGRGRAALHLAAIALVLAGGVALFRRRELAIAGAVGWGAFPLDDSWIHLQFARNIAEGHGFSYNPGVPVAGSTAPLWTLLLATAFRVGGDPAWAKGLGVAGAVAAAWGAWRLAMAWTGRPALGLCAGALTALAGPVLWGALSGMEVTLAAALVTWALALHATQVEARRASATDSDWGHAGAAARPGDGELTRLGARRAESGTGGEVVPAPPAGLAAVARPEALAALLAGLAAVARPEAVVLAPLLWLAGPRTWRRALAIGAIVGACLSPWVLFNLATGGSPLPVTASAKIEGGLVGLLRGGREPLATALVVRPWNFTVEWVRWLASVNALLPVAAAAGLLVLWRRGGAARAVPALVLALHPLAMALLAPYQGPAFQEGRYSIHLLPLGCALAAMVLAPLVDRGHPVRGLVAGGGASATRATPVMGARGYVAAMLGAALLAASAWSLPAAATRYAWGVQNIEGMQVRLGRWVAAETAPDARLALNDIGAITYLSRREVVDVMGLVTPSIIPAQRAGELGVLAYLERACPDYLVVFPAWFPAISAMTDRFRPVHRVRLDHNLVCGADEMVVFTTPWTGRRSQAPQCDPAVGRK